MDTIRFKFVYNKAFAASEGLTLKVELVASGSSSVHHLGGFSPINMFDDALFFGFPKFWAAFAKGWTVNKQQVDPQKRRWQRRTQHTCEISTSSHLLPWLIALRIPPTFLPSISPLKHSTDAGQAVRPAFQRNAAVRGPVLRAQRPCSATRLQKRLWVQCLRRRRRCTTGCLSQRSRPVYQLYIY